MTDLLFYVAGDEGRFLEKASGMPCWCEKESLNDKHASVQQ